MTTLVTGGAGFIGSSLCKRASRSGALPATAACGHASAASGLGAGAQGDGEAKKTKVTLQLLWLEYRANHAEDGYRYSRFCELYGEWLETVDVVCRQPYEAGEKGFVDYAGPTVEVIDPDTGHVSGRWYSSVSSAPRTTPTAKPADHAALRTGWLLMSACSSSGAAVLRS